MQTLLYHAEDMSPTALILRELSLRQQVALHKITLPRYIVPRVDHLGDEKSIPEAVKHNVSNLDLESLQWHSSHFAKCGWYNVVQEQVCITHLTLDEVQHGR